jgi:hypothetical protein
MNEVQVSVGKVRVEPGRHFECLVARVDGREHLLGW